MSPVEDDPAVWAQIVAVAGRLSVRFVVWLEEALPLMLPASIAAYLIGRHFGYRDAALRMYVATGVFASVVGTPAALAAFGLEIEIWKTAVCCGISAVFLRFIKYGEVWLMKKLEIERRGKGQSGE